MKISDFVVSENLKVGGQLSTKYLRDKCKRFV